MKTQAQILFFMLALFVMQAANAQVGKFLKIPLRMCELKPGQTAYFWDGEGHRLGHGTASKCNEQMCFVKVEEVALGADFKSLKMVSNKPVAPPKKQLQAVMKTQAPEPLSYWEVASGGAFSSLPRFSYGWQSGSSFYAMGAGLTNTEVEKVEISGTDIFMYWRHPASWNWFGQDFGWGVETGLGQGKFDFSKASDATPYRVSILYLYAASFVQAEWLIGKTIGIDLGGGASFNTLPADVKLKNGNKAKLEMRGIRPYLRLALHYEF